MDEQIIFIYVDDSGVLHKKSKDKVFVYGGYIFTSVNERADAERKYKALNKKISESLNTQEELKACILEHKHRNSLYKVLREYHSFSLIVNIEKIYDYILEDKKAICRYKDFVLKVMIKTALSNLINLNMIDSDKPTKLIIQIDEQLTSSNGIYNLKQSIYEEFKHGIVNYNYNVKHNNLFSNTLEVSVKYRDSKHNYLIQASDILANRIYNAERHNNISLFPTKYNHFMKYFP